MAVNKKAAAPHSKGRPAGPDYEKVSVTGFINFIKCCAGVAGGGLPMA